MIKFLKCDQNLIRLFRVKITKISKTSHESEISKSSGYHSYIIWICFQNNNGGLISFSVDEAEEEVEEKEERVKEKKEKSSGNILVVETDFERMPRRSSFRSKERRELTRSL